MLSYVKDANDFINKVKDLSLPKDSILASLDVKSLYTNIQTAEGIAVLRGTHEKYQIRTVAAKLQATILRLILTLHNFISTQNFVYKLNIMQWRCAPHLMQISLWHILSRNSSNL